MEAERTSRTKAFFAELSIITATGVLTEVDMGDAAEGNAAESLLWVVTQGVPAIVGTAGHTLEFRCQESDTTGSGFVDVPITEVIGGQVLTDTATVGVIFTVGDVTTGRRMASIGKKRFQRLAVVEDTSITVSDLLIVAHLEDMRHDPQADQNV